MKSRDRTTALNRLDSLSMAGHAAGWQPVVVVCVDGGDPAYFQHGVEAGFLCPMWPRFMSDGFSAIAEGTMPNFTCPNNLSLSPAVHPRSRHLRQLHFRSRDPPSAGDDRAGTPPGRTIFAEIAKAGGTAVVITPRTSSSGSSAMAWDFSAGTSRFRPRRPIRHSRRQRHRGRLDLVGMPLPTSIR